MSRTFPLFSAIARWLTSPAQPSLSLGISENHLTLIALSHRRGEFEMRQAAVVRPGAGLIVPSFTEPNIRDEAQMLDLLNRLAQQAAMTRIGKLNVSLPSGSARSMIVALDSAPTSTNELLQLLEWKVERATGFGFDQLRVSHQRLADIEGKPHWIVSIVRLSVIDQYESLFERLGWKAGTIMPQALGEASWLLRSGLAEDQMLVSTNSRGFEVVIVRGSDPILIREVECSPEEVDNEFYRLVIFYRDRLLPGESEVPLRRILTVGTPADQQRFQELAASALERTTFSLTPGQVGLNLDPGLSFNQAAAAAGLSAMAWGT